VSSDQAYNQGVNDTKMKFKAQMPQFEDLFFARGWKACLTKQDVDRRDTVCVTPSNFYFFFKNINKRISNNNQVKR
jgi:hypothetical protein